MKRIRIDRPRPKTAVPEEAQAPQEDLSFEELMARGGVKRLEDEDPPKPVRANDASVPRPQAESADMVRETPAIPEPEPSTVTDPTTSAVADELAERVAKLEAENARLEEALRTAHTERDTLDAERRALARRLSTAEAAVADAVTQPLAQLLERRGCRDAREREECIRRVVQAGDVDRFLALIATTDTQALETILDQAVSFVCKRPECRPAAGSQSVFVEPDRCEVCGGSDLQLAAKKLFDTCVERGLRRIRIIGGSPTYHTRLRDLAEASDVELKLISGIQHRTEKQARADQKHADLVVLWGGTLLDHATSGLYDRSRSAVLTVAHRGLAGMLGRLAGMLEGGAKASD